MSRIFLCSSILLINLNVFAASIPSVEPHACLKGTNVEENPRCKKNQFEHAVPVADALFSLNRLHQHEGTTIFLDYSRGNRLDGAIDVDYSFKYRLSNVDQQPEKWDYNSYVTFNGAFDFYAGTRASGPVRGRRYNIGYQGVWSAPARLFADTIELRWSLEHESNGQPTPSNDADRGEDTIEANEALAALAAANKAREEGRSGNEDIPDSYYTEMATETVSRGYNFLSFGTAHMVTLGDTEKLNDCNKVRSCFFVVTKLRQHITRAEDFVFWEPRFFGAELYDYQGTTLSVYNRFNGTHIGNSWFGIGGNHAFSASIETGEIGYGNFGDKVTFDVSYMTEMQFFSADIPIIVSYHNGYLEELYNYHERDSYLRVGFHMTF